MAKKNAVISLGDPTKRAEIEARRGIQRDEKGQIIHSKEWKKNRKVFLEKKQEDLSQRLKNVKTELKTL